MEQFVLGPASVYNNKRLKTQTVTRQGVSKYEAEQSPTYQIDSLKKEQKKQKTISQSGLLSLQILSCPRTKLSYPQISILDRVKTGVLLSDSAQQFYCKNAGIPGIYFTLLDAAEKPPTLVLNKKAKTKTKEAGSLSTYD